MARTTLAALIGKLREMTNAGTADYIAGTATFWTDNQLQDELDRNKTELYRSPLSSISNHIGGGSIEFKRYVTPFGNLETTDGGTAIFIIEESNGDDIASSAYSVDYVNGIIDFNADRGGTAYFLTARTYNLNSAAANVWRSKSAYFAATQFDFTTDEHGFKRSQKYDHAREMVTFYESKSGAETVEMFV